MTRHLSGGCQCGAVRYAVRAAIDKPSICHCRMCQKAFGSYFAPLGTVPVADLEMTRGTISYFRSSDVVERGFCSACGTPLTFHRIGAPEIDIALGSLDEPSAVPPVIQYGIEGRMPWFAGLAGLPGDRTTEEEEPERAAAIRASNHQHPDHDTVVWPPRS